MLLAGMGNNTLEEVDLCGSLTDELDIRATIIQNTSEPQNEPFVPKRTNLSLLEDAEYIDIMVWDELEPYIQEGDIVVNTYVKSGTTWMIQVILQMLNNGEETLFAPNNTIHNAVPWMENTTVLPKATRIAKVKETPPHHRRVIKSHLQRDELLFNPKIRYVCVFRDGREVAMSLYNHFMSLTADFRDMIGKDKGFENFDSFYDVWLRDGNRPFWSDYFDHLASWFECAHLCENILLVNYSEMQLDLASVVLKVAKFLDIHVDETAASFTRILHRSSFEYMKQHEELFEPPSHVMRPGNFIHKGVRGRWRDVLSASQKQAYWDKVTQKWSPELIEFVHKHSDGPPESGNISKCE